MAYYSLKRVYLGEEYFDKYPHQLSGGELQRIAIARAIALHPEVLICDEATSSLDVTIQKQIMELLEDLKRLPAQIEMLLSNKERIQRFANRYVGAKDVFFIGRGIDYAISMEGSLKLKEISYIHSEAYAAGELKHGTISLIEEGTLVAAVATQDALFQKTLSNMVEVKARGAFVLAVTTEGNTEIEKAADYVIYIPKTNAYFANSLAIIPLQLFGYYVAVGKGCDVDKPRNLAKSVTVE